VIQNSPARFRNEKRQGGGKELKQEHSTKLLKSHLQPRQNAWAFSFIRRFPFFRTVCWVVLVCFTTTNLSWARGESFKYLSPSYKINKLSRSITPTSEVSLAKSEPLPMAEQTDETHTLPASQRTGLILNHRVFFNSMLTGVFLFFFLAPLIWGIPTSLSLPTAATETIEKKIDERKFQWLVRKLRDENWDDRSTVANTLVKIGNARAVDVLIRALKDENIDVRRTVAGALGEINDARAVDALTQALRDEDSDVRKAAGDALVKIGDARVVGALMQLLKDDSSYIRIVAAEALGEIKDARAVDALIQALKDDKRDDGVRIAVAHALGEIRDTRAIDILIRALKKDYINVRIVAAGALGEIGGAKAVNALIRALKDENENVRIAATYALGEIGDVRAVDVLIQVLKEVNQWQGIRIAATGALGKTRDDRAVDILIWVLKNEDNSSYIQNVAADALSKILGEVKDTRSVDILIWILKNENWYSQRNAAKSLVKIWDTRAVDVLIRALKDENSDIQGIIIEALGEIRDARAIDLLIPILRNEDNPYYIRVAAADALGEIGDARAIDVLIQALRDSILRWGVGWVRREWDMNVRDAVRGALVKIGDARVVDALIQLLKDENMDVRISAAGVLGEIRDSRAVNALVEILKKDQYSYVRGAAAFALGEIRDTRAVPVLVQALKDENKGVRISAVGALGKTGDDRVMDILIRALKGDENENVRSTAADALGKIGDTKAVNALIRALKGDENENVRSTVAAVLGKIGDAKAVNALIRVLKDENVGVRISAVGALGEIGDARAIDLLIPILRNEDDSSYIQSVAADALAEIFNVTNNVDALIKVIPVVDLSSDLYVKAIEALRRITGGSARAVEDPYLDKIAVDALIKVIPHLGMYSELRIRAVSALGRKGDPKAVDVLIEALSDADLGVQRAAGEALGKIRDARAVDALIHKLEYEQSGIRSTAADALGKIGDAKAVNALIRVLKDENEDVRISAAGALGEIGDARAIDFLIQALKDNRDEDKNFRIAVITALSRVGDVRAVKSLRFIAYNQFKHGKKLRQAAKEALQAIQKRNPPGEWVKATEGDWNRFYIRVQTKVHKNAKYLGLAVGMSVIGFLVFLGSSLVTGQVQHFFSNRERIRNNPELQQGRLPFVKTLIEVSKLKKEERVKVANVRKILRFGVESQLGGGAILLGGTLVTGVLLIFLNSIYTYLGAVLFTVITMTTGVLIQSDVSAKAIAHLIDAGRVGAHILTYPLTYLKLIEEYHSSNALTPEHFYLLRRFKKEVGEKLFDDIRKMCSRFTVTEQRQILGRTIDMAYQISKQGKDARDLLEIQIPVAIEVSEGLKDFEANLEIVERILTGPYDVGLTKDKQRFKAFFEKVGKDLRPVSADETVELIGLLERRLTQQGFHVGHFYDEVFLGMDKDRLSGGLKILLEIVKQGFFPTEKLLQMAKEEKDPRKRGELYSRWQREMRNIREWNFDITNPLHIELEYSTFRRIIDNSRIISEKHKEISYKEYLQIVQTSRAGRRVGSKEEAELKYAAYEAMKLKEFIDKIKEKARSFGREVLVIPNLSYGRFASIFIEGNMRLEDIQIAFAKVGSSDTHENPYFINPQFLRSTTIHNIVSNKPVIIVVDGSFHEERYPDAYQGYLNLAIALNDVFSKGDVTQYADMVGRPRQFINELRNQSSFKSATKNIRDAYDRVTRKDSALYSFHFWNPRGKRLNTRSSWKTRRGVIGTPASLLDMNELKGPAIIFVNSVLTDSDLPKELKEDVRNIEHNPAYFDDKSDISVTNLFFKFDDTGIHLVDAMHDLEMRAVENVMPRKQRGTRQFVDGIDTAVTTDIDAGISTVGGADFASSFGGQNIIRLRRLLDELEDKNSKIREDSAESLGEFIGNESAAVALGIVLRKDPKKQVRYWAASSLGAIGVKSAIGDLSKALKDEIDADVREEIVRAIGKIGDKTVIPTLSEVIDKEREVAVKQAIISALRNIRDKDVLPILLKRLREDKNTSIRSMAGEAYLDVGREGVVPETLKYLNDKDPFVRMMLIEGLGDLVDKRAVNEIGRFLGDREPSVRHRAAWALGNIGDIQVLPKLEGALKFEEDSQVREMVTWAVERLRKIQPIDTKDSLVVEQKTAEPQHRLDQTEKETRGLILDLDGTLAPLGGAVPDSIHSNLLNALESGKQIAVTTLELKEKTESRLWGQIPAHLRKNLHIFSNGGTIGFGFDQDGGIVSYFRHTLTQEEKDEIFKVVNSAITPVLYQDLSRDYKIKIRLDPKIRRNRRELAERIQEGLDKVGIKGIVVLQSDKDINIFKFDKVMAARFFMEKTGLREEEVVIIGDKARSFGLDRRLLTSFPRAISINIGSASPTIRNENPNIIQTEPKNLTATASILEAVNNRQLMALLPNIAMDFEIYHQIVDGADEGANLQVVESNL